MSTRIFVLQLLVGGLVYWMSRDPFIATVAVGMLSLLLLGFGIVLVPWVNTKVDVAHSAAIAALMLLFLQINYPFVLVVPVGTIMIFLSAWKGTLMDKSRGAKEPLPILFCMRLPVGIGTIVGGVMLLYRWFTRNPVYP